MTWGPGGVIAAAWIAVGVVWLIGSLAMKATVRRQSALTRLLDSAPVIAAFVLLRTNPGLNERLAVRFVPGSVGWQVLGAIVTVAGVAVAIWARFYLGRNWSSSVTVKQNHQLIRSGPYRVVRHPIYSGFLLAIFGTAIYAGEVRGLLALAIVMVGWKIKSLREEAFMEDQFGEQYVQYRREVKGLVPFVW